MTSPESDPSSPLLVACLCAEWCGVCNAYIQTFEGLKALRTVEEVAAVRGKDAKEILG